MSDTNIVERPLVIMFREPLEKNIIVHLYPEETDGYEGYGLLITDLVRHVAHAFNVDEDDVWEWVDKERYNQTTEFIRPS